MNELISVIYRTAYVVFSIGISISINSICFLYIHMH